MTTGRGGPGDTKLSWQTELERNFRRMKNLAELASDQSKPMTGLTPREEIATRGKARLYRYAGQRSRPTPVLFVPNLGISRPYIFDLLPNSSFVEAMGREGFDLHLLDWGLFDADDRRPTLEDCVMDTLPHMAREVLATSRASGLSVIGYCMGASLSASFLATHPDGAVKSFVNMAGPIDFSQAGLFTRWLAKKYFDVDRFVDTLGSVPSELIKAAFKLLKPTMDLSTNLNLWWNLWNERYVEGFRALNTWANEYVAIPGEFFRQWVRDFYQENRLYRGELSIGGRPVRLGAIRCPVLAVGAAEDNIAPPASVRALLDVVGSEDHEYLELPGGHISLIAGRSAAVHCWPRVAGWLAAHP